MRRKKLAKRSRIRHSILDAIGNTPLLHIRELGDKIKPGVEIWAKLEMFNPGGSVKDRPALQMIEDAEKAGVLTPEKVILDSTSGNTGIAYAMIGAAKGYHVELVMPESVSIERRYVIQFYGADLVLSDPLEGSDGAILKCREILAANPDLYYKPDQYNNPSNSRAHYLHTAPEIWSQTQGRMTHFVATLGTSGTVMGTGRGLKAFNPDVQIIAVEPPEFHGIEGLKNMDVSIVPGIYDPSVWDQKIRIETEDAYDTARWLTRDMGLLVGQSCGAAMAAALKVAETLDEGVIVTMFPDSGEKYMSTPLWRLDPREVAMFDKAIWDAMFVHAQREYPAECCGIVTEDASGVQTVHLCDNIQDKLYAADPETHSRTSRTAYRMDDMQVMKIQSEAEQAGGRVVAIYHSHIDVDAYFSQEDQDAATFFGGPTFPGVVYPIIPVKNARVDIGGEKVFQWRDSSSKFEEVEIG